MQTEPATANAAAHGPATQGSPDLDRLGIHIVMCDAVGRPRSGRLLRLADCLARLPARFGRAA